MFTFYTKLKTAWREVDAYGEASHCDCSECSCNVNSRINEREDRLIIRKFLVGLNDQYRQVRSHILSMDPIPNLNKVYSLIVHEEAQQQLSGYNTSNALAFYTSRASTSKKNPPSHSQPQSHVGKSVQATTGNTNAKKRSPPPSEPLYYKSGRQVNTKYYCFHCTTFGHSDERCYDLQIKQRVQRTHTQPTIQNSAYCTK